MIVLTGATGHIGSALARELVARGDDVRAFVLPSDDTESLNGLPVEIVTGDVRNKESLLNAFKGADYVYHLAGIVFIGSGNQKLINDVNIKGTRNVIEACIETGVKRLVYVSSIHAFTEPPHGTDICETKDFNPLKVSGNYAKSKAAATLEVLDACRKGLNVVIVHPTGVIGPYEYKLSNTGQLIVDFIKNRLFAYIDGAYDFVDVRDVASGIMMACDKGVNGENYILSGERLTVKQLLGILEKETGIKAPKLRMPRWLAYAVAPFAEVYYKIRRQQPLYTTYSIATLGSNSHTTHEKAARELGYKPRPLRETVRDTVAWFSNHKKIPE
ncbi:MAG: SDR family oxidoreductase [Clostridiales bacterium]|nr:SDR family oxidoreductase [Clostridiales bacterium]